MKNPIIRIAAKFQNKIPSLRILAVMDTISWSRCRPHRNSCTFLQRSWSRKDAVDVSTFLRPHLRNWCWKPFSGMLLLKLLLLLLLLLSLLLFLVLADDDACPPTIFFKFITKFERCYYKVRQLFYYKVRQVLLQSATTGISKCDRTTSGENALLRKFIWPHFGKRSN